MQVHGDRMRRVSVWLLIIVIAALAGVLTAPAGATAPYVAVDLGNLGSTTYVTAINHHGQFVGNAFSWTQATGFVYLGSLGGGLTAVTAVNDSGQVAGYSITRTGEQHAFMWTQAGGMIDLGTLRGVEWANAISEAGQVVGSSGAGTPDGAFSWTPTDGMTDLGTLGGTSASAVDVNSAGQVVGWSTTAQFETHAFIWTKDAGMVDLGTLGGNLSAANAINESGQVVGWSRTASGNTDAFSWTRAGGMVDLGPYSNATAVSDSGQVIGYRGPGAFSWTQGGGIVDIGGRDVRPSAVNGVGQVVGMSPTESGQWHAFSWTQSGGMVDLGTIGGGTFSAALATNDAGQIFGYGYTATGEQHAILWQPAADAAPPVLTIPTNITADAVSPRGTKVTYAATAADDMDPNPLVTCTPPSGSEFAIGTTTTTCTATDASGNSTSGSFSVHVKGAAEQLVDLEQAATGTGPGKSLSDKSRLIETYLAANRQSDACATLADFISQVTAQTGKQIQPGTTLPSQAGSLIATSARIENVIGC